MGISEVIDLTTVCQSFPESKSDVMNSYKTNIIRDNFLDMIDTLFESNQLVVVEGEEGNGKTTLLSQFALRHENNAICRFIKNTSKLGYDQIAILFDLCNQIKWILHREIISDPEETNEAYFRTLILKIQQYARWKNEDFYFIIDGIDEIPNDSEYIRDWIFEIIPFGLPNFKFLLTGDLKNIPQKIQISMSCKSMPLTGFTLYETTKYFEDLNIQKEYIEEIFRNFKKPGHLSHIKRVLLSNISIEDFISNMPQKLPDLFELEWKKADINEIQLKILGLIAFDRNEQTIKNIADILNLEYENTLLQFKKLNFICIDQEKGIVSFSSESFKKFAINKLSSIRDEILDLIMDFLQKRPNTTDALIRLPDFFAQKGKYNELVKYLNPDNFEELMKRCQSFGILKQKLDLGIVNAENLDNDNDFIRFSTQKSIINEISNTEVLRSEIETRLVMNDYNTALALAQNSPIKEDRLHSLAIIAKHNRENGFEPEQEINEQIRQLFSQIDYLSLGNKAIEIASDLIYSNPDLAIELVEKSTNSIMGANSLDWAYSKLALAALAKNSKAYENDFIENLNVKISDNGIKGLNSGIKVLIGDHCASEVIFEVEKLESTSNRIFLLRQWLQLNRKRDDTIEVIEYALKLIINESKYSPNARVYRDLATPLPNINDICKLKGLIGLLDSQKEVINNLGPTEEFFRLQLIIAEAEYKIDFNAVSNRIVDIYLNICEISDLSVKAGCLAWLVVFLVNVDFEKKLEKSDKLHTLTINELDTNIDKLLDTTADHFNVVKTVIKALARTKLDKAYEIAMKLNTQNRRDMALYNIVESSLQVQGDINVELIQKSFNSIYFKLIKDKCFMGIVGWLNYTESIPESIFIELIPIINYYNELYSEEDKCVACITIFLFVKRQKNDNKTYQDLCKNLINRLDESWKAVDSGSDKINLGFKITKIIYEYLPEKAKSYLEEIEQLNDNSVLNYSSVESAYILCLDLAIRAFGGLINKRVDKVDDLDILAKLINMIPSLKTRIEVWYELAIRYYFSNRKDDFNKVVNNYVKPLIQDIINIDIQVYFASICNIAPILYLNHNLVAHDQISEIPIELRDIAYSYICQLILRKCSPSDPYEISANTVYNINYEEIINLCDILNKMDNDAAIYEIISNICESVSARKSFYTSQQRADISAKLKEIINNKFPNKRFIKHDGYKIIALAQVAHMEKANETTWNTLLEEGEKISNVADKAFVLCIIAILMPKSTRQRNVIYKAKELVESIPSAYDKADRYETLGQLTWDLDKEISKECFRNAMKFANKNDDDATYRVQRRIIDTTYRLEPELASSLASLLDSDEAKRENSGRLKHRMEILKMRKYIEDKDYKSKDFNSLDEDDFQEAAWMLLGSLNSGRIAPVPIDVTYKYLNAAKNLQISEAYPLYAWVIENAVKKLNNLNQTVSHLRPIFDSLILSTELALRVSKSSVDKSKIFTVNINSSNIKSEIIRPGEREKAIDFLIKWLKDNINEYVKICDPYFGPKDMAILQLIQTVDPKCIIKVLTSIKAQNNESVKKPWDSTYIDYWRSKISDQNPPDTFFTIVGTQSPAVRCQ